MAKLDKARQDQNPNAYQLVSVRVMALLLSLLLQTMPKKVVGSSTVQSCLCEQSTMVPTASVEGCWAQKPKLALILYMSAHASSRVLRPSYSAFHKILQKLCSIALKIAPKLCRYCVAFRRV